jgi:NADPH:quinone reductase-like Zn-dependent oxidoreductase
MPGIKVPLPVIIGLDMAGEIAEVGPGVAEWKAATACWSIRSTRRRA